MTCAVRLILYLLLRCKADQTVTYLHDITENWHLVYAFFVDFFPTCSQSADVTVAMLFSLQLARVNKKFVLWEVSKARCSQSPRREPARKDLLSRLSIVASYSRQDSLKFTLKCNATLSNWLFSRESALQLSEGSRNLSHCWNLQTGTKAHLALYVMGNLNDCYGVKAAGRGKWTSTLSVDEVNNEFSCKANHQYVLTPCAGVLYEKGVDTENKKW